METLLTFVNDNLLAVGSLFVAVLGVILAYVFYRRSQRNKEPSWDSKTVNLIRGISTKLKGLNLLYNGEEVTNISVTTLIFWNNGDRTIDRNDVPTSDPMRIAAASGVRLLHTSVIGSNNPPSEFALRSDSSQQSVKFDFEYLDKAQGAVIQVVHDGLDSSALKLVGTVKGAQPTLRRSIAKVSRSSRLSPAFRRALAMGTAVVGLILIALFDLLLIITPPKSGSSFPALAWLGVLLLSAMFAASALSTISEWRYLCPPGLEAFLDEIPSKKDGA